MSDHPIAHHVELRSRFGGFGETAADKLVQAFGSPSPELTAEIRAAMIANLEPVLAQAGKAHVDLANALGNLAVTAFEKRLAERAVETASGRLG